MTKTLIELKNVKKTYRMGDVELNALDGISLKIEKGEFVAITGASGSGKSTMMHLVGCLDTPSQGNIFLEDTDISLISESRLAEIRGKKIGFIFQKFNLISTLTALDNVILPMDFQNNNGNGSEIRAKKLLESVGLGDRVHHKPGELSGGQAQRVAIARALANNPEVILADEPTGNLDSKTGETVMDFLCDLHEKEGKTVILVTHDLNLVKFAKRVVKLKDGKIESDTNAHKHRRNSK
ncbi:MAG: ABC transporter ATP-binding protein [Candidatus Nanoarchaeia archaeon]|nr:ABC transporter ATP-binding protein [Candidatus Nanoarchaeia archaeon]